MRATLATTIQALLLTPLIVGMVTVVQGEAMQSSSYKIESDSVNFGGGLGTSTNYTLESTAGEIATGESGSSNYNLKAGYQQMHEVYIAISDIDPLTLAPSIPGISGGFSNGSTTLTVTTDSTSGYGLTIAALASPAMQKGADSITDYVPAGAVPDFTFTTDATDAHFGFTPEGADITLRYQDDGGTCGVGGGDAPLACWDGLSTSEVTIASRTTGNHPYGSTTTLNFRVGVGGSVYQAPGVYIATTTLTALPL